MFISHSWLKTYIDHDLNPEALGELITFQACPVEDIEHLEAGDACLELEVTFNRADLLGHIGVAKEVAAGLAKSITEPVILLEESSTEQAVKLASVFVEAKDLCPRYTARVIRGVKIGPSPAWLQQRLEAIDVRPVNNVVDVTNFVLHECGQPLHAFDFATLKGAEIVVRRGREGETITAIDGTSYSLTRDTLVIADQERPVAIAGIMGGQDTEISEGTTDILLESAYFDPVCTRRAVRRLGLRSDSSHRFERGVDPERVEWASRRAAQLISEVAGGQVAAGFVDADAGTLPGPQTISLRL
ncbi:MAG: phenylalanine--tRNA ligase subunit beta, partial [Planctomycetota bacterium]